MVRWAGICGGVVRGGGGAVLLFHRHCLRSKTSIPAFLEHHLVLWRCSGRGSGTFLLWEIHGMSEPHLAPSLFPSFCIHSPKKKRVAPLRDAVTSQNCKVVEMVLSCVKEYLDISKPFYNITENSELLLRYSRFRGRHRGVQTALQRPQSYSRHVDTQSAGS